jgi:hypothetical protein
MKDIWIRYKNDSSKSLIYAGFFLNDANMKELEEEV